MVDKNKYMQLNEDNDFGFTFSNDDEIINSSLQEQVDDLKQRLHALNKMFLPLLENLAKDSDKPMIKWPNRKEVIDKQIARLKSITKV